MCTGTNNSASPAIYTPPRDPSWPTSGDVEMARKYDQSYGDPSAPPAPDGVMRVVPNLKSSARIAGIAHRTDSEDVMDKIPRNKVGQEVSDSMTAAYVAAQRSPLAAIGFDPRRITTSPKTGNEDLLINIAGVYDPTHDQIWSSGKYDSTLVHESLHRGMEKLRKAGMLPESANKIQEEYLVRAFMLKHFGDVEKGRGDKSDSQISIAKDFTLKKSLNVLNEIEDAAAKLYAKERPRGPR